LTEAIRVHPPGPFPPHGVEKEGEVDLGIRLRDMMFTRSLVTGMARRGLAQRLQIVARDPMRLAMASSWIQDLPMTWPLGALVDDARERWTAGPDPEALAVLLRVSHLVAPVLGWPTSIDRRWPMPDPDWVKTQLPPGQPLRFVPRGLGDGTAGMAIVFEAEVEAARLDDGRVLYAGIDEIEAHPERYLEALAAGAEAVQITTPGPTTEAGAAAWHRVRAAATSQAGYELGGRAGLGLESIPRVQDLLTDAPPGKRGERYRAACDVLFLPTLAEDGSLGVAGVMVWDGPYHPVRVVPGAADLVRHLDEGATPQDLAETYELDAETTADILDQLVGLGAVTAVT
jgi:hypothetical protein